MSLVFAVINKMSNLYLGFYSSNILSKIRKSVQAKPAEKKEFKAKKHLKYFVFQENFLEKFLEAERECCTICFPDIRNFREDVDVDEEFFDLHILKQQKDEGWFRYKYTFFLV
jgi:hypothetical protein